MAVPPQVKYYTTGDIFVRNITAPTPAFFTDIITLVNSGGKAVYLPAGTPLTSGNLVSVPALSVVQKLLYLPITVPPATQVKACVIDAKGTVFTAPNSPVNFAGIRINLTKMPMSVISLQSTNAVQNYTYANMKAMLSSGKLNIPFFEESIRFDPAQT